MEIPRISIDTPTLGGRKTKGMLRSLGFSLMCLAMFSIAGGHWAVLQTVAWAQMVREYSKTATVAEALEKTFSGKAPCSLCEQIAEARQQEEKSPATLKTDKKAEVFLQAGGDFLRKRIPSPGSYFLAAFDRGCVRMEKPAVPVPRIS